MFIGFGGAGVLALGAAVVGIARAPAAKASRSGVARVIPVVSARGAFLAVEGGF
jgi:hypothetical protein